MLPRVRVDPKQLGFCLPFSDSDQLALICSVDVDIGLSVNARHDC